MRFLLSAVITLKSQDPKIMDELRERVVHSIGAGPTTIVNVAFEAPSTDKVLASLADNPAQHVSLGELYSKVFNLLQDAAAMLIDSYAGAWPDQDRRKVYGEISAYSLSQITH